MSTAPGYTIDYDDTAAAGQPNLAIATAFVLGELQRGPDRPVLVTSMRKLAKSHGARTLDSQATYDWLEDHFAERGGAVYVLPLRGPAATRASATFAAASGTSFTARATSLGTDGERYSLDVNVTGSSFTLELLYDARRVALSPPLADTTAAQVWIASKTSEVEIVPGSGGDPVATSSPTAFDGGDDDLDGVTVEQIVAEIAKFRPALGPGSLVLPGRTVPAVHEAMADHCISVGVNRKAVVQLPDTTDVQDLVDHAATLRVHDGADVIDMLAGRQVIPGLTPQTVRVVDATALRTGREAANDKDAISPNQPAAGDWGQARYATAITTDWSDEQRRVLNDAGVNVLAIVDGRVQLFGARTAADPEDEPAGFRIGACRMRMAIREVVAYRLRRFSFAELDSKGQKLGDLRGKTKADIRRYEPSLHSYDVSVELEDGELPGQQVVEVLASIQPTRDAEVIHGVIKRISEV